LTQRVPVKIAGRELEITNLDRPYWPESGLTKSDLLEYYHAVAPYLLKYLRDRPLVLTRYPTGIRGEGFYQKDCPDYAPEWIRTWSYYHENAGRKINYILCDSEAALIWLANQGAIELHPWASRIATPQEPDFLIFDLDPDPPASFDDTVPVAFMVRQILEEFGLKGYPKTSGATGLHIYVPVRPIYPYRHLADLAGAVADLVHRADPGATTRERRVSARGGKVYIDHLQNIFGKTIVSVYSPRPRPGAPVSMPVSWSQLPGVKPEGFSMKNFSEHIEGADRFFRPLLTQAFSLEDMAQHLLPGD